MTRKVTIEKKIYLEKIVDVPIVTGIGGDNELKKFYKEAKRKKYVIIKQEIKEINRGGFFSNGYIITRMTYLETPP